MAELKKRILVVDDERSIHHFFIRLFTSLKVEIIAVENGYQAVEEAKKGAFDLYFIDCRMPGMDGLETMRQIQKIHPEAKIAMITGYAADDMLEQAQKEGAVAIMRKPFDITALKDVFYKVTDEAAKHPKRILVVDDDKAILIFFANLLSSFDIPYTLCADKKEAFEALSKEAYDLIFLDLVFEEGISGVEIYGQIQRTSPQAAVVVITGYPEQAKEITGNMNLTGCLFKPFGIGEIIAYVEKVIGASRKP